MLKRFLIPLTLFSLLVFLSSCMSNNNHADIFVEESSSFFSDFVIEDNTVSISCHLEVKNNTGKSVFATFYGDFSVDKEAGLLTEEILTAYNDKKETLFLLNPGINSFDVVFIGGHGGANIKQNRSLPMIRISIE